MRAVAMCAVLFFWGFPLLNYMPRFFLGGILIYAAMPFLELLVLAYWRVSKKEFVTMWIIVVTNAVAGIWLAQSLLIAVLTRMPCMPPLCSKLPSGGLPSLRLSGAFSTLLTAVLLISGVFSAESWLAVAVMADVAFEVSARLGEVAQVRLEVGG